VDEVDLSAYAGQVGDKIAIRAHDDFDVSGVRVAISSADGHALESGAAVETPPNPNNAVGRAAGRWLYTATAAVLTGTSVRIEVTATDRPGHKTVKTATK
jgi:hypothetical protein